MRDHANELWSSASDLREDLKTMNACKPILNDKITRLDTNILSNHFGLNHDLSSIVDPRRFAISDHPGIGLVYKSHKSFL